TGVYARAPCCDSVGCMVASGMRPEVAVSGQEKGAAHNAMGELLIVGAQISFAAGAFFIKKLSNDTNPYFITHMLLLIGTVLTVPVLFYFPENIKAFSQQKLLWFVLA